MYLYFLPIKHIRLKKKMMEPTLRAIWPAQAIFKETIIKKASVD